MEAKLWDWQGFLASLERFGVQLGLERMSRLLKQLDHPQRGIAVIHVAGTNGKGSVCAMLSQILLAAGYRVGRYTSPHLVSWRERIWLHGSWISESEWAAVLGMI
jgi:dihydrofolate synthase/folylpolyglutamate synthase